MKSTSFISGDVYLLTSSFKNSAYLLVESTYHQGALCVCKESLQQRGRALLRSRNPIAVSVMW